MPPFNSVPRSLLAPSPVAREATFKPFDKAIQIAHFGFCAKDNGVRLTGGNVTLDRRPTVHYPVQQQLPFGTQRRVKCATCAASAGSTEWSSAVRARTTCT